MQVSLLVFAWLSLLIWFYLVFFRGGFWRCEQRLSPRSLADDDWPSIVAVVPARNEAAVIAQSLTSLLDQDYPGRLTVIVVDDHSDDATQEVARAAAGRSRHPERFIALHSSALPLGWTGKLWALQAGVQYPDGDSEFVCFTDADIEHPLQALRQLVAKAQDERRDLVSVMVSLRCKDFWERCLIPPFIYFFQKLYPFAWVQNPQKATAAAAGGCILVRREALSRAGGLAAIRGALIDDCALAAAVKASGRGDSAGIWLGLACEAHSIRPYAGLADIWAMVARTAYTQLHYSPLLLLGTLVGMGVTYLVPPLLLLTWPWHQLNAVAFAAALAWALMSLSLLPTLKLYGQSFWRAPLLPLVAALYSAMTFDSARRHWLGVGGYWKGRVQGG